MKKYLWVFSLGFLILAVACQTNLINPDTTQTVASSTPKPITVMESPTATANVTQNPSKTTADPVAQADISPTTQNSNSLTLSSTVSSSLIPSIELEPIGTLTGHTNLIDEIEVSSDNSTLASIDYDSKIIIWDIKTQNESFVLDQGVENAYAIAFSDNGDLFATIEQDDNRQLLQLRETSSGEKAQAISLGFGNRVPTSIAFQPNQPVVAVSGLEVFLIWNYDDDEEYIVTPIRTSLLSLAFSPDGKILAGGTCISSDCPSEGKIVLWDTETGYQINSVHAHTDYVSKLAFSPDGTLLASLSLDNSILIWDAVTLDKIATIPANVDNVFDIVFSSDSLGLWMIGSKLQFFETQSKQFQYEKDLQGTSVAIFPNGEKLAVGNNSGEILLFDISSGQIEN